MDKDLYRENRPIDFQPTKKDVMAAYLQMNGYTLRAITKIMGYGSTDEAYRAIHNSQTLTKAVRVYKWYDRSW